MAEHEGSEGSINGSLEIRPSSELLSRENIEAYMEGCEDLALRLNSTINKVIATGKRPVVVIPSRGAVPIFLQARRILNDLDSTDSYLLDENANYYPNGVFEFLEEGETAGTNPDAKVDVLLFPFTADVSLEENEKTQNGSSNGNGTEWLAKILRQSSARSVLAILAHDYANKDLRWYEFVMSKLADNPEDPASIKAKQVLDSLKKIPQHEDAQIILIDTVISGRASNDITTAFQSLGHPVVPILAVDNSKGGKFQQRRRAEIEALVSWDLIDAKGPFIDFPLITEDKGSALLGLAAINFANFNEKGAFSKVSTKFPESFLPQSCVWTLPPSFLRDAYLNTFRHFLDVSWRIHQGQQVSDDELELLQSRAKSLMATHVNPSKKEIAAVIHKADDIVKDAKETNSHITSVKLNPSAAEEWIKEFASK